MNEAFQRVLMALASEQVALGWVGLACVAGLLLGVGVSPFFGWVGGVARWRRGAVLRACAVDAARLQEDARARELEFNRVAVQIAAAQRVERAPVHTLAASRPAARIQAPTSVQRKAVAAPRRDPVAPHPPLPLVAVPWTPSAREIDVAVQEELDRHELDEDEEESLTKCWRRREVSTEDEAVEQAPTRGYEVYEADTTIMEVDLGAVGSSLFRDGARA